MRISIFGVIAAHTRKIICFDVGSTNRGYEAGMWFINGVICAGVMPRHVLTDKGVAFNVIKGMMLDIYGDLPPGIVQTAEGPISVNTFQAGSSVHNTPIERSWGDANDVTHKYVDICDELAAEDLLSNGHKIDNVDDGYSRRFTCLRSILT